MKTPVCLHKDFSKALWQLFSVKYPNANYRGELYKTACTIGQIFRKYERNKPRQT